MINKLRRVYTNPKMLVSLHFFLLFIAVLGNSFLQVFCIPTIPATIILLICFTSTIIFPIINNHILQGVLSFINGISLCLFIYCILFLEHMNSVGILVILFFGLGLLTFIPHYFVIQLFWKYIINPTSNISRYLFITGIITSIVFASFIGIEYNRQIKKFEEFEYSNYQLLDDGYLTEKILGMHFIYHTKFCEFDGWRPPKHDPFLVIGMWLNGNIDPLKNMKLEDRINLYRKFYPNNPIKFDCSCAWTYSDSYHGDPLWDK